MSLSSGRGGRKVLLVLFLFVAAAAVSLPIVGGAGSYSLSISDSPTTDSVDVPERTFTIEGSEYTVSEIGRTESGGSVPVVVSIPDGQEVEVHLRNHENQNQQVKVGVTNGETVTFSTDSLSPGTYFAAIYYDGQTRAIVPVIVEGYDVAANVPSQVPNGGDASVTVTVSPTASSGDPHLVQVVVGDASEAIRVNATESGDGYEATVPTDDLSTGTYAVYAVVRGETEMRNGRLMVLAVSDRHSLSVTEETPTPTSSYASGGEETGDATPTPTQTRTTPTLANSSTATPTATPSSPVTTTDGPTMTRTATAGSAEDNAITPGTEPSSPTSTRGQPGFGVSTAITAVIGLSALLRRS